MKELPETNPKQILLITDGVTIPPREAPTSRAPDAVRAAIETAAQGMKKDGWKFDILRSRRGPRRETRERATCRTSPARSAFRWFPTASATRSM